jgi:chromosome segregation protein
MLLKSIELSGFKSFAKKSAFQFTSAISAIVGPNGSGKSNVAEAFRFVLGEQSMKSMRGKRGEDLIWNGGKDTPRSNRAEAKVIFDNSRRFLNIDFDEVALERVVNRDSSNEYYINGSQARLKDIIELLAQAHIGSSGHHIISQGEADRILGSSMRERREMIEDALGLKIYQYKIQESERKLEKTLENLNQVESLRKEIAPHLRFLKKQVEKLERAEQLKENLKSKAFEYLKREEIYLSRQEKNISGTKSPLEEEFKSTEIQLLTAKEALEKSANKDSKSQEVIQLESKIKETRNKTENLLQEIGKLEGKTSVQEEVLRRQKEVAWSNEHKTVSFVEVENLANEIEEKSKSAETEEIPSVLKEIVFSVRQIFRRFIESKKGETDDKLVKEAEQKILELNRQKSEADNKLLELKKETESLNGQYENLRKEIELAKDSSRDAEKKMFEIMSRQKEIKSEINILREKELRLMGEREEFKREIGEIAVLVGREIVEYKSLDIEPFDEDRPLQEGRKREIEKFKIRLEDSGLSGSEEVIKEFRETSERDAFLEKEISDLKISVESLKRLITDLSDQLDREFKEGIEKINKEFQNFFTLMFNGGSASLKVVRAVKKIRKEADELALAADEPEEQEEEFEEGIDIDISLPKKKIKGLMMLSGGERALTSIALLFAMSQVNPPPFIILDETDAALDEANSRKYGDMIENLSKSSQLILITHNRETMSRAGVIYGVTMDSSGVSKTLSIQFDEATAVAK